MAGRPGIRGKIKFLPLAFLALLGIKAALAAPGYAVPQKAVAPVAPTATEAPGAPAVSPPAISPPAARAYKPAAANGCGLPYPCRLQSIIDHSDWKAVLDALSSAMPRNQTPEIKWSSRVNNHSGYVQQEPEPSKPVCRKFEVVAYMGAHIGKEKVDVCRDANGELTVR